MQTQGIPHKPKPPRKPDKDHCGEHEHQDDPHTIMCCTSSIIRARHFYSMLLEPDDLQVDQNFHMLNMRRHIASMHGSGTVCGLHVGKAPCGDRDWHPWKIIIEPGIGVDCLGREMWAEKKLVVDVEEVAREALSNVRQGKADHWEKKRREFYDQRQADRRIRYHDCPKDQVTLYVGLCYWERDERPVQAIGGPETCCKPSCQMSRTRHGFCVYVTPEPPEHQPPCLYRRVEDMLEKLEYTNEDERDVERLIGRWITQGCFACEPDPCCKEHHCVTLAEIFVNGEGSITDIDNFSVRPLVYPALLLQQMALYAVKELVVK